jgi:ubiquinone/menaquinone biosynthesis C-methylase UbiE
MSPDLATNYHQILDRVERDHWWFVALREFVVDTLTARMPPGSRILDVGCSTGHVIAEIPDEYERTGADTNAAAIGLARAARPEIPFVVAPVELLPFEDRSFDGVLAFDVLSDKGVEDEAVALREIRRVLRPGGLLLVQLPAYAWLKSDYDDVVATTRRYNAPSLRRLLQDGGFVVEHLTYRITALFPLAAIRRLLAESGNGNDLRVPRPTLNRLLTEITRVENRFAARHRLPFGLSVFAVAAVPDASAAPGPLDSGTHNRMVWTRPSSR